MPPMRQGIFEKKKRCMKSALVFLASILSLFAPIKAMAIASAVVVILDMFFGIWAAKKQGIAITSNGLKQTIIKAFVYEAALVLGFIIQTYLLQNSLPLTNLVATLIGCTELKSVAENLEIIVGQPFLTALIQIISNKQNNPQ